VAVKEAVMPFNRFRTASGAFVDTLLGPEMRSTGEVMGLDLSFGTAYAKTQSAGGFPVPSEGTVFVSIANRDKRHAIWPIKRLADLGFRILATSLTAIPWRVSSVTMVPTSLVLLAIFAGCLLGTLLSLGMLPRKTFSLKIPLSPSCLSRLLLGLFLKVLLHLPPW